MGDLTWSVKMPEDLKEKIADKLQESGLTGKEFIEALLCSYEIQSVKEKRPEIAPDMQELEALSKRICSIYANMGERISTLLTDKEDYYKTALEEKNYFIKNLEDKIKEIMTEKEELEDKKSQIEIEKDNILKEKVAIENRLMNEVEQISEINKSNKALIEEYKQKNDTLTGLLKEYETYKKERQELNIELDGERNKIKETQRIVSEMEDKLKGSQNKLIQVEEQFKDQLKVLKEQYGIEKEKALLEQEKSLRNELQILRDEYNNKVKGLLDELEARHKSKGSKVKDDSKKHT